MNDGIERLIDRAGRDRVFARAKAAGWTGYGAPEFVWRMIAVQLILERAEEVKAALADQEKE